MIALGLDTTGRGGAVALASADQVLGLEVHDPALGYAEELFTLLDRLLAACDLDRRAIDRVAVVSGPGSFTGLRIGVMTAKALALGLDRPLWSAPTLDLIAAGAGPGKTTAVADAGGGHLWAQDFDVGAAGPVACGAIRRIQPDALEGRARVACAAPVAIGRPVGALAGILARCAAAGITPARAADPQALVPDYASVSQAERVHGLDLTAQLNRPIEPRGWDT